MNGMSIAQVYEVSTYNNSQGFIYGGGGGGGGGWGEVGGKLLPSQPSFLSKGLTVIVHIIQKLPC